VSQRLLQIMFPSACSFIVFWFSLSFTTCFGLHGHLHVCRILFICLKDSAKLLFCFAAFFFSRIHTLHVFHLCFLPVLFFFVIFLVSFLCVCVYMCVCICVCVYVYVYVYVYVCVCVCVCVCVSLSVFALSLLFVC
jgi:hypothetical protein